MGSTILRQAGKHDFALDKVMAILVLCLGIAAIAVSLDLKYYGMGLSLFGVISAASLAYLLFRGRLSQVESFPGFQKANRIRSISHIVFIISVSLSVWVLWGNLYYRPPLYFVLCLVAAGAIVLDIFSLNIERNSHTYIALFKIIALSLVIYAGIYYQFPGIYGSDPWQHNLWIQEIVSSGQIPISSYYLFPLFHLIGAAVQILTSLSTYSSIFVSIGVYMAISSIFVFLIGRKLVNTRAGLLAALIVPLTSNAIERGTAIIPMSLGFCFFLAILCLIFYRDRRRGADSLLILLLSVALILTHSIAALVTLVALVAIAIGFKWYQRIGKSIIAAPYQAVSLAFIAFFSVTMLTRWMQSPPGSSAFFDWNIKHLVTSSQIDTQLALARLPAMTNIPFGVQVLNQGGYLLLLAFAIVGALIYLHPRNRTGSRLALILTAGTLFVIPQLFLLASLYNIMPGRWHIFLYMPLSILGVGGLLGISNLIKGKPGKLAMAMLIVLAIIFMMSTTSNMANGDSPWLYNGATRIGYTQSELTAIATLSTLGCGAPETDINYGRIVPYVIGSNKYKDMTQGMNRVFILRNYYLQHSEWDTKYTTAMYVYEGGRYYYKRRESVLIADYRREHNISQQSLIYNNGNVKVYALPKPD